MKQGPRGRKHLLIGILFVVAGALIAFGGTNRHTPDESLFPEEYIIPNQGGEREGHTPRGFAGFGTGLFIGDNLNPNFPNTDGVQTFLSFDLSSVSDEIKSAVLFSDSVTVRGTPFEDLGSVVVDQVAYDSFSAKTWNTPALGGVCSVEALEGSVFSCDVTETLQVLKRSGASEAQFRLRFENASDEDSEPDLLLFFNTDSNTNEPGIFLLRINDPDDREPGLPEETVIELPIILHRVVDSGVLSTTRSVENIEELFKESERIWRQANISFDSVVVDTVLDDSFQESIFSGDFRALYGLTSEDDLAFHVYFFNDIGGPNGIAFPPFLAVIADETSVNAFRATAHEIGHLLDLPHTSESTDRLLFQGVNGEELTDDEISVAREYATVFRAEIDRR